MGLNVAAIMTVRKTLTRDSNPSNVPKDALECLGQLWRQGHNMSQIAPIPPKLQNPNKPLAVV